MELTRRSVIERKLLAALDDEDKVALLLSRKDLDMLISSLGWADCKGVTGAKEMEADLKQLRAEAFPPNVQAEPPKDGSSA